MREWEVFRRHLVHLHYDELAQWLVEAGIPRERIWSSQGFMAPPRRLQCRSPSTFASPTQNYDSGGMSVEGAMPALGHLGVILYGEAAVNDVPMENGKSLFATFAAIDPGWAIVEYNTADLRNPKVLPTYAAGYRGLRDMWNFGARYVSPMAWNGSNGIYAGQPGYVDVHRMAQHAARGRGARLHARARGPAARRVAVDVRHAAHADGDGWTADAARSRSDAASSRSSPTRNDRVALVSPKGLPAHVQRAERIRAGLRRARGRAAHPRAGTAQVSTAAGKRSPMHRAPRCASPRPASRSARYGAIAARRRSIDQFAHARSRSRADTRSC